MIRVLTVCLLACAGLAAQPAAAADIIRFDDTSVWFESALGKQVDVTFSDAFAASHLSKTDYDAVVLSGLSETQVCLFGASQGLDAADPKLADVARDDGNDICVARSDVAIRAPGAGAAGTVPEPFYSTDKANCAWSWKAGQGTGLWTEDCRFENGRWTVTYDPANDWFALRVDEGDPYPVVRPFRLAPGQDLESLLSDLKAKGLVLDDAECVFMPSPDYGGPAGWSLWQVMPVGKRKQSFDAQNAVEVPEPPCGELGYAVDSIGFFAVRADHPDRAVYINLGQDGTMIDPYSITFD